MHIKKWVGYLFKMSSQTILITVAITHIQSSLPLVPEPLAILLYYSSAFFPSDLIIKLKECILFQIGFFHLALCLFFLPLSLCSLRQLLFSLLKKFYIIWIYNNLFTLLFIEGHLDCFQIWTIVDKTALNIRV